ncbi:hypothetical protein TNCV_2292871 [Trichonephila clavipes]|nr:hypothetical protein TNCV_2292871 [Trichonephila clavipes]
MLTGTSKINTIWLLWPHMKDNQLDRSAQRLYSDTTAAFSLERNEYEFTDEKISFSQQQSILFSNNNNKKEHDEQKKRSYNCKDKNKNGKRNGCYGEVNVEKKACETQKAKSSWNRANLSSNNVVSRSKHHQRIRHPRN